MKRRRFDPKQIPADTAGAFDDRFQLARGLRAGVMNKIFPDHWSFLLGEIALFSFILLLLSGTFLALFYDPSMEEVIYNGAYTPLRGVPMSKAFASSLDLSFEVRGGLIMRQMHHWGALLFMAAIFVHMFRIFFTGAFRKPRETNWLLGIVLLNLGFFEGFIGYSLPDDALSGTGLRIASGIVLSIPLVGTWAQWALFGGEFPGTVIIPRFYILHVFLLPGLLAALIVVHIGLVFKQKHTQWPGPARTERNVVGYHFIPDYISKQASFSMIVFGVIALMSGLFQINPIWLFGPYKGEVVSSGSQPDWYVMFMDGMIRLYPPWEIRALGYTVPAAFFPAVLALGLAITLVALYPFLERRFTKDTGYHNLLQRPRDVPARTALGAAVIGFYVVNVLTGVNDVIALRFDISLNAMTWAGRIGVIVVPAVAYFLAYRICLGLQQHDREVLVHGVETGIVRRSPTGHFVEVHQPLAPVDEHGHPEPLDYAGASVPKKMNRVGALVPAVKGFFVPVERPTEEAPPAREREEVTAGRK